MTNCIDIYASVSKEIWEVSQKKIMELSIDNTNYATNNDATYIQSEGETNLNIRILKSDLDKLKQYASIFDSKELNEDGSHKD